MFSCLLIVGSPRTNKEQWFDLSGWKAWNSAEAFNTIRRLCPTVWKCVWVDRVVLKWPVRYGTRRRSRTQVNPNHWREDSASSNDNSANRRVIIHGVTCSLQFETTDLVHTANEAAMKQKYEKWRVQAQTSKTWPQVDQLLARSATSLKIRYGIRTDNLISNIHHEDICYFSCLISHTSRF